MSTKRSPQKARQWQARLAQPGHAASRQAASNGSLLFVNPKALASNRVGAGSPIALLMRVCVGGSAFPCAITCTAWPSRTQGERTVRNDVASAVLAASNQQNRTPEPSHHGGELPFDTKSHENTDCALRALDLLDAAAELVEIEVAPWSLATPPGVSDGREATPLFAPRFVASGGYMLAIPGA